MTTNLKPSERLLKVCDLLLAAGHQYRIQDNILVTGKQLALNTGFDKLRPLTILVMNNDDKWTIMWQVKIRRINEGDEFFNSKQTNFVMEQYREVIENNVKIKFGEGDPLKVVYENELNDDNPDQLCVELYATAQIIAEPEIAFGLIQQLFIFPQYEINLYQDQSKEFHLEIIVPEKG